MLYSTPHFWCWQRRLKIIEDDNCHMQTLFFSLASTVEADVKVDSEADAPLEGGAQPGQALVGRAGEEPTRADESGEDCILSTHAADQLLDASNRSAATALDTETPADTSIPTSRAATSVASSEGLSPETGACSASSVATVAGFTPAPGSLFSAPGDILLMTATDSTARLRLIRQPETQHRARYLTEGSRGAVKDKQGDGYPMIQASHSSFLHPPLRIITASCIAIIQTLSPTAHDNIKTITYALDARIQACKCPLTLAELHERI
ncbi:unnamed protein product [Protopolystoma xenopodis]|uniref:Uncharacterized protein n=1 Tax=Protopolystoma xenopodis TaxID=117903 RepID=A0A3S5C399_9PLAT|nr:unnamed protein product [Protopolystoma xenopodis]